MTSIVVHRFSLLLLAGLALAACGGPAEPSGVISRARFVSANVAVRALGEEADSSRRAQVLKRYRVSEDDLRKWVRAYSGRPEELAAAWEEIAHKTDSISTLRPTNPLAGEVVDVPVPGTPKMGPDSLVRLPGPPGPPPQVRPPGRPGEIAPRKASDFQ